MGGGGGGGLKMSGCPVMLCCQTVTAVPSTLAGY